MTNCPGLPGNEGVPGTFSFKVEIGHMGREAHGLAGYVGLHERARQKEEAGASCQAEGPAWQCC